MSEARRIQGEKFDPPMLQFDYESSAQSAYSPYSGLRVFGPYDKHVRKFGKISALGITPENELSSFKMLTELLKEGWSIYPGFEETFGVPLSVDIIPFKMERVTSLVDEGRLYENRIKEILQDIRIENYDIALIGIPKTPEENVLTPYYRSKAVLAAAGLPSQMVTWEVLHDATRLRYSLMNIAIAIYAKVGGRPWALVPPFEMQTVDCFLGIGMTLRSVSRIGYKFRYVGFVTIFKENGCYLFTRGVPGVMEYEKYLEEIGEKICGTLSTYERMVRKKPHKVVIHSYKRTSRKEREAIVHALSTVLGSDCEYVIVRITEAPALRLFDFEHRSMATEPGICVPLSGRAAIISTTGRRDDKPPLGTPVPMYVTIEEQSPFRPFSITAIAKHAYLLSKIY